MDTFKTQFTLSRDYLEECFDQSLPFSRNAKPKFLIPLSMLVVGTAILLYLEPAKIAGAMFIAFALLELIHIKFRRSWWIGRQRWGKNADSEVHLTVSDEGIQTVNAGTQSQIAWDDIEKVIETDLGLILVAKNKGQQYLSGSLFSSELKSDIITRGNG